MSNYKIAKNTTFVIDQTHNCWGHERMHIKMIAFKYDSTGGEALSQ